MHYITDMQHTSLLCIADMYLSHIGSGWLELHTSQNTAKKLLCVQLWKLASQTAFAEMTLMLVCMQYTTPVMAALADPARTP